MAPNDIVAELRQIPFQPFTLYVVDGPNYDIMHPDQCMVLLTTIVVGVNPISEDEGFQRSVKIDCRLISRMEPIIRPQLPARTGPPPTLDA